MPLLQLKGCILDNIFDVIFGGHRWCMAVVSSCRKILRPKGVILLKNLTNNGEHSTNFLGQYRGKFKKKITKQRKAKVFNILIYGK